MKVIDFSKPERPKRNMDEARQYLQRLLDRIDEGEIADLVVGYMDEEGLSGTYLEGSAVSVAYLIQRLEWRLHDNWLSEGE